MRKVLLSMAVVMFASTAYSQDFWTVQNSNFTSESRGALAISAKTKDIAWAYAFDGSGAGDVVHEFTKTVNGGTSWTAGDIDLGDPSLDIQNIVGIDGDTAWVMASREEDGSGGVYRTIDGGESWEYQMGGTTVDQSWNNWVHFYDKNVGVFGSDPVDNYFELYRTTDSGENWTRVPSANIPTPLSGEYGYTGGVTSVGDIVFFYTNKGRVIKSTDKGLTWSVMLPTGYVTDFGSTINSGLMAFSSANTGMAIKKTATSSGVPTAMSIYTTTNGGQAWQSVSFSGLTYANNISGISYVPGTNTVVATSAYSTGSLQGSWISKDNGVTWTNLDSEQHLPVKCVDDVCFSGGYTGQDLLGGMYKSSQSLAVNESALNASSISVYPNPVVDHFKVDTKGFKAANLKVSITDASGKLVKEFDKKEESYNMSGYAKGVYVVIITDGVNSIVKKIIKK